MKRIELYNLHIGSTSPSSRLSNLSIGPFTVKVVDDYENKIKDLYEKRKKITDILGKNAIYKPASPGGWAVTAIVEFDEKSINEKSILLRNEDPDDNSDNGLWDLCAILTFLTGRRVVTKEYKKRYNPTIYGDCACVDAETLRAASIAWESRQILKDKKIIYSLLCYNESLSQNFVQILAALYNCSLNIILDKLIVDSNSIDRGTKKNLKAGIKEVIYSSDALTQKQKEAYSALINGKIDQGTNSLVDKLKNLLIQYKIIEEPLDEVVKNRIRYVSFVRNKLTHAGELPTLKGLNQDQSDRYSFNIIGGIVPELSTRQ